jgi:hypothetical protein
MTDSMRFQIWSLEKLPQEVRSLQFPQYPFTGGKLGPVPIEVLALFHQHQIIYYRDEVQPFGIIVDPESGVPIASRESFIAYKSSGLCHRRTLAIERWQETGLMLKAEKKLPPEERKTKYERLVDRNGDDFAWLAWNQEFTVAEMTTETIQCL